MGNRGMRGALGVSNGKNINIYSIYIIFIGEEIARADCKKTGDLLRKENPLSKLHISALRGPRVP